MPLSEIITNQIKALEPAFSAIEGNIKIEKIDCERVSDPDAIFAYEEIEKELAKLREIQSRMAEIAEMAEGL